MKAKVKNCPIHLDKNYPYIVVTPNMGELWYFSAWSTYEDALNACLMDRAKLGIERVVLEIE